MREMALLLEVDFGVLLREVLVSFISIQLRERWGH